MALRQGAVSGALAGVAGGLVFGAAMSSLGTLPTVASIVRADSPYIGFAVHMTIAALVGAGFGLLVAHQRAQTSELLFWGLVYGAFWWFLGPQTLLPLLLGKPVAWDLASAQALLPSLIGHLFYGATTAVVFVALRRDPATRAHWHPWTLVRGLLAGVVAGGGLLLLFAAGAGAPPGRTPSAPGLGSGVSPGWLPAIAVVMGLGYPLVFTGRPEGTGPALVRGTAYGFLWWIVAGLTVPPLLHGAALDWSRAAAAEAVSRLPAYVLLGAGVGAVFTWLGALSRGLFVDDVRLLHEEGAGARGLRATGYGAAAGLVGGLIFGAVWGAVDRLSTVAQLVGARGTVTGLIVHLVIAQIIGVSYALLFRRRSFDLASGLGWGVSYGFFWWVFGVLTLLPVLLGDATWWTAPAIARAFPSLVGHLAYGAALGVVFQRLENRENPWWVTRSQVEAERVAARREQTLGSAPALWMLTVLIALTIPLLVSG
ncbi:MAG: hypothetical protein JWN52_5555 [Actinomycetia bacterium]|nr:hypothetical protein [Actinomycetes bacterium]